MSPALVLLISTIGPMAIEQVIKIYEAIASDPGTPAETAKRALELVDEIKTLNVDIADEPIPGDEPEPEEEDEE